MSWHSRYLATHLVEGEVLDVLSTISDISEYAIGDLISSKGYQPQHGISIHCTREIGDIDMLSYPTTNVLQSQTPISDVQPHKPTSFLPSLSDAIPSQAQSHEQIDPFQRQRFRSNHTALEPTYETRNMIYTSTRATTHINYKSPLRPSIMPWSSKAWKNGFDSFAP